MKKLFFSCVTLLIVIAACNSGKNVTANSTNNNSPIAANDTALFRLVQQQTFQYFWDGAEPTSGLARERFHSDNIYPQNDKTTVTSGGGGFGVMAILVGIERGFITKEQGVERFEKIVHFLETADRFHGAWPHWWNGETGKIA